MSSNRHLKNSFSIFVIITALWLSGCGDKTKESKPIAGVNDAYLSEQEFLSITDSSSSPAVRAEAIQHWVKTEVLYQKAVEEGIVNDPVFLSAIERSTKELAAAMLTSRILERKKFTAGREEVAGYYDRNKEEFALQSPMVRYNIFYCKNEETASKFRSVAIELGWQEAQKHFENAGGNEFFSDMLRNEEELESRAHFRAFAAMLPGEISLVLRTEQGLYFVSELIAVYPAGGPMPFSAAAPLIERRLIEKKKAEYLDGEIKALYAKSKISVSPPRE